MAFDEKTVVELVRSRLGLTDNSQDIAILWCIPHALDRLARKVAANKRLRPLLLTLLDLTTIPLDPDGNADLVTYSATARYFILLEYLHFGNIFYVGIDVTDALVKAQPMQQCDAQTYANQGTTNLFQSSYISYWLDGTNLRTVPWEFGSPLTGELHASVPYRPTIAQLADISELHELFIEKVLELLPEYGGADAAEDDAK